MRKISEVAYYLMMCFDQVEQFNAVTSLLKLLLPPSTEATIKTSSTISLSSIFTSFTGTTTSSSTTETSSGIVCAV
ncbi:hypothetical protein CANARDRAFT_10499 [[Candida] arabinofermentans NRRL YB-2248]|uniref:Uncharacterized protein n=1 Tax=[Candida] arabinofermentans NRRL YB-2248 TaxID=983967 RepID=A0A1E4SSL6_9ASCO|nr:hypothetical protein CANARDRAFT_10499 [[Candida] arabinofermentans NRRL YB-2248]